VTVIGSIVLAKWALAAALQQELRDWGTVLTAQDCEAIMAKALERAGTAAHATSTAMKVKDLIDELQKLDPETLVVASSPDGFAPYEPTFDREWITIDRFGSPQRAMSGEPGAVQAVRL
jgi:hypothetical protein